jgi:hypothetical protein
MGLTMHESQDAKRVDAENTGENDMTTKSMLSTLAATAFVLAASATSSQAQQTPPQFPNMTFFITSVGGPQGANYGGLEGADRHCQTLATKAGAGAKTWRAYLSTQAVGGATAVNARDRIGKGPWVNANGVQIATSVEDLHSDNNKLTAATSVAESGRLIPSRLYTVNQHDILTGTQADGTAFPPDKDMTCGNWTKNGEGSAMVGHTDRMGLRDDAPSKSWNTSHPSRGCDAPSLVATGGAGLLYCFAAN